MEKRRYVLVAGFLGFLEAPAGDAASEDMFSLDRKHSRWSQWGPRSVSLLSLRCRWARLFLLMGHDVDLLERLRPFCSCVLSWL